MVVFHKGVKGVLSDAISYESALRKEKLQKSTNTIHTGYSQSSRPRGTSSPPRARDRNSDGESGEDDFVKTWRKNRMQELKTGQSNTRRRSPSKRKYGRVEVVDAVGYLDAVERVSSETIVVVTIYNDKVCQLSFACLFFEWKGGSADRWLVASLVRGIPLRGRLLEHSGSPICHYKICEIAP